MKEKRIFPEDKLLKKKISSLEERPEKRAATATRIKIHAFKLSQM